MSPSAHAYLIKGLVIEAKSLPKPSTSCPHIDRDTDHKYCPQCGVKVKIDDPGARLDDLYFTLSGDNATLMVARTRVQHNSSWVFGWGQRVAGHFTGVEPVNHNIISLPDDEIWKKMTAVILKEKLSDLIPLSNPPKFKLYLVAHLGG